MADTYKAASVLYNPVTDDPSDASGTIAKNLDVLIPLVADAKSQGAQIIVFPESYTGTLIWPDLVGEKLAEYAEMYPAVGAQGCTNSTLVGVQHSTTACAAMNNSMYIVMNIPELLNCTTVVTDQAARERKLAEDAEVTCDDLQEKRVYIFNSLAIYGPQGTLVAKYRKTNTYPIRYDYAYPEVGKEKTDLTTFTTSFGVDFAVLICADAFNPHIIPEYIRKDVKNILIPFYDGGRPPVYSITGIHGGYSHNYGVNVIASQSQTFSGVGVFESGRPKFWSVNADLSGAPYTEMVVVELAKDPEPPAVSTVGQSMEPVFNDTIVETCRWLGNEGTEVDVPCIKIAVPGSGEAVDFVGTLKQPVDLAGKEVMMNCTISASLKSDSNETQTYVMMAGWRDSELIDELLFCEIAVCHDFPDCSKDCPICLEPYIGGATLTKFHLAASVPEYFENGDRQMRFPMMNGFAGRPASSDIYDWIGGDDNMRFMNLVEGEQVPSLMGAGAFYIGFAPLEEEAPGPTPSPISGPTPFPVAGPTPVPTFPPTPTLPPIPAPPTSSGFLAGTSPLIVALAALIMMMNARRW